MNRVFSEFVDPDSDDRWLAIDIPIREEPDDDDEDKEDAEERNDEEEDDEEEEDDDDDDGEGNSDGYSE